MSHVAVTAAVIVDDGGGCGGWQVGDACSMLLLSGEVLCLLKLSSKLVVRFWLEEA
jgi:hypothetical protein